MRLIGCNKMCTGIYGPQRMTHNNCVLYSVALSQGSYLSKSLINYRVLEYSTLERPRAVSLTPSCSHFTPMTALPHSKRTLENSAYHTATSDDVREVISSLALWPTESNLLLNVSRTSELIAVFRKEAKTPVSVELMWSRWTALSSWGSTWHHPERKKERKKKKKQA